MSQERRVITPGDPDFNLPRVLPARGLGDTIANGIQKISRGKIKPCGGCKKRQALLNKVLPYNRVPR